MLTAIIVDDERKARENLQILIEEFCEDVEVLGLAKSVQEARNLIDAEKPDLVFLDVQLQRETGFDLLELYKKIDFEVIFTTAYTEYALKAIKFSAIDYLLKPIDIADLQNAINKSRERIQSESKLKNKLEILLQNIKPENSTNHKIALPTTNGLVFLKLNDILYCEGQSNYTVVHTVSDKKYVVSKTLKEYEDLLSDHNFFRIHKSFLINLNEIREYVRGEGGYVIMNNKKSLDVSKRRKESFIAKIKMV